LTDPVRALCELHRNEKDSGALKVGQVVRIAVDAYPGRKFEGKITTIEPQIATDTRNIRVQATIANPNGILKPGMFATTTGGAAGQAAVVTVPERGRTTRSMATPSISSPRRRRTTADQPDGGAHLVQTGTDRRTC